MKMMTVVKLFLKMVGQRGLIPEEKINFELRLTFQ